MKKRNGVKVMFLNKWMLGLKRVEQKILKSYDKKNCSEHISAIIQSYLERLDYKYQNPDKIIGLSTEIKTLDNKLQGLRGGEIILLASRPCMGKTSFAMNLSYKVAQSFLKEDNMNMDNKCVLYFSSEAPSFTLCQLQRIIAEKITGTNWFDLHTYKYGSKSYEEFATVANIGKELGKLPLYICDDSNLSLDSIKNKIKKISGCSKIGFIVIDEFLLFSFKNSLYPQLSYITLQGLKDIAQKLNVPILVLGRLSRNLERRSDKHPLLSDVDSAIKLSPYCDKILFLYRESYYLTMKYPEKKSNETKNHFDHRMKHWEKKYRKTENECEIIIAKNKQAFTGTVKFFCNMVDGIFDDLESSEDDIPF